MRVVWRFSTWPISCASTPSSAVSPVPGTVAACLTMASVITMVPPGRAKALGPILDRNSSL